MDVQWLSEPKKLLYIFPNYPTLRHWLESNTERILKLGGTINRTTSKITFPNGNTLWLGHAEREEDKDKYIGLDYDSIAGSYNEQLKYRELTHRRFGF